MATSIPKTGGAAGGGGTLSPQAQAQLVAASQQIMQQTAIQNQQMIAQSQAQLDQITGGVGKLGGPTGFENLANNMLGPVTGGGPLANQGGLPGATGLDPTGGLGATPGLGGLGTAPGLGGLGATPGLGTVPGISPTLDPTGLGAGNLASPLGGLMGGFA